MSPRPAPAGDRRVVIRLPPWVAGVCALAAVPAILTVGRPEARAAAERRRQEAEIAACRVRLRSLYGHWQEYREEFGVEPPGFEALVSRYLPDPEVLECPTAARLRHERRPVTDAPLRIGRWVYHVTYGFRWLAGGDSVRRRRLGDAAPLIVCQVHREAVYRAAFNRIPPAGVILTSGRNCPPAVASTPVLAVLRNGSIRELREEP